MKILYVTTIGGTMGFFPDFIKSLIEKGHEVHLAANTNITPFPKAYDDMPVGRHTLSHTRSPFNKGNLKSIKEIRELCEKEGFDLVHCHTPIAAMCTRLALRPLRKKGVKVFYTAHGFHFYKGAPLKNWLLYYPMEKLCSYFTDILLTINEEDFEFAKRKMKAKRIEYVHGVGLDTQKIAEMKTDREKKRAELGVPSDSLFLLSVGELNSNKNHSTIIKALSLLKNKNIHYAIAGRGSKKDDLMSMAESLGIGDRVHVLGFRTDVLEIYKSADVCVFPSIREGLGKAALEGMAAGLPLIASDNRGTRDYAKNNENAILCDPLDEKSFAEAISLLYENADLRKQMGDMNPEIAKRFDIRNVLSEMDKIYFD
jgi:glycosyltransferase involved in cell wall biosynthesis